MTYSYIGKMAAYERDRQGVSAETVCKGLCDLDIYNSFEKGEDVGDIHVVRMVLQRLGISASLAGRYLCRDEYDEIYARFNILELLRAGRLESAKKAIEEYENRYCVRGNRLNMQFMTYMNARIAQLDGDTVEALCMYKKAIGYTIEDYGVAEFTCISIYEYFMLANIAQLNAALGNYMEAEKLYERLLAYCHRRNSDCWTMACVYPKTICEMLDINTPERMGDYDRQVWLNECNAALKVLSDTSRLHYICPLLNKRHTLLELLGEEPDKQYDSFLEHYEWLRNRYHVEGELLEWYPYYNSDWEFYPVEKLINERRKLYGMTIEELAEGVCAPETVSRIINRRVSPKRSTVEALLDKLGLRGVLLEDVMVCDDWETHRIWDDMVHAQAIDDYVTGRRLNEKIAKKLDVNIPINRMLLEYVNVGADMGIEKNNYEKYALLHEKMLGFNIENIEKLTIFTRIETMVINRYFYCMDKVKNYTKLGVYEHMCNTYLSDSGNDRASATNFEGTLTRCASYTGNAARFTDSNNYSEWGINLELNCERMHCLSTIIYCIPWNNAECGNSVSDDDIKMCECAYWIAWMLKEKGRMKLYNGWIEKHNVK